LPGLLGERSESDPISGEGSRVSAGAKTTTTLKGSTTEWKRWSLSRGTNATDPGSTG
jgi:hypothetical protein